MGPLLGRLGLELLRTQRLPAVAAAWAARAAARQRGWGGWGLLPGGGQALADWKWNRFMGMSNTLIIVYWLIQLELLAEFYA